VHTGDASVGDVLRLPLNSYEGNFVAPAAELERIEAHGQVLLRYCDPDGDVTDEANPNGSSNSIAGIRNESGNVAGLMPHPERASDPVLGSTGGVPLFASLATALVPASA
jgi:phosphoribosylformylglycinamidine synthase